MLRSRPLASLAAGFVAGIAIARILDAWPLFAALSAAAALLAWKRPHPAWIALLGASLGGLRQDGAEARIPGPLADIVEGVVAGPPRVYRALDDPDAGTLERGSFVVGSVQVRYFDRTVDLIGGERVKVRGKPRRPAHATNPGQFDYGSYLERQGIDSVMTLESIEILEKPPAWSRARAWVRSLFDRDVRPDVGAFQSAIVLGRREAIPDALVTNLQRSGTAHLLAISGQNLVYVMLTAYFFLTLFGIRGRSQTILLLAATGLYTLLTGLQVSVVRSYLMMAAFFGADLCWRRRDAPSALGAAALAICAIDPGQVADAGFQLSFAAVLGLALIAPVFHAYTGTGPWAWDRLRMAIGVSAAAWLATAPIVLEHFNLITPVIVLANLVLVPLLTAEFILGLAHLLLAPIGLGAVSGSLSALTYDSVTTVSAALTSLPFAYAYAPAGGPLLLAVYYGALAAWTAWSRMGLERWWKIAALTPVAALLGLTPLAHRPPDGMLLAVLDVGRGSCAYMEWPDGRNMMVDCGSLNSRDPGASIAARYLWTRGVTRLDTLVLSHPDEDHVNGARTMIDLFRVRRVVVTPAFRGWTWPAGVEKIEVQRLGPPVRLGEVEILGPPAWEKFGRPVPPNETSIVLRAAGVLLPGDIEERGVEEVLTLLDLRARVLVMPHHGKFFKQHEEFVRRVAPETVIVSAPEGYYRREVIDALPVTPRITGREGAIEIILK